MWNRVDFLPFFCVFGSMVKYNVESNLIYDRSSFSNIFPRFFILFYFCYRLTSSCNVFVANRLIHFGHTGRRFFLFKSCHVFIHWKIVNYNGSMDKMEWYKWSLKWNKFFIFILFNGIGWKIGFLHINPWGWMAFIFVKWEMWYSERLNSSVELK